MRRLLLILCVAAAVFAAFVATRPGDFRIERREIIDAPPEIIYRNLEDFRRWEQWSPWEKLDPAMQREFSGPSTGEGATYHWRGNRRAGEGRMTVVARKPPERLALRLEFLAPLAATDRVEFEVTPDIAGTNEVRWEMSGENGFVAKAIGLFVDMDGAVGTDFERGLTALKKLCEAEAAAETAAQAGRPEPATTASDAAAPAPPAP
jgi:uncharacterized protein YndB with AHSA1/START domain